MKHIFGIISICFLALGIGCLIGPAEYIASSRNVFIACMTGGLLSALVFVFVQWASRIK